MPFELFDVNQSAFPPWFRFLDGTPSVLSNRIGSSLRRFQCGWMEPHWRYRKINNATRSRAANGRALPGPTSERTTERAWCFDTGGPVRASDPHVVDTIRETEA